MFSNFHVHSRLAAVDENAFVKMRQSAHPSETIWNSATTERRHSNRGAGFSSMLYTYVFQAGKPLLHNSGHNVKYIFFLVPLSASESQFLK